MATHRLSILAFEAGFNVYTGTPQGGHAYAHIIDPARGRHELEYPVDRQFIDSLREQYRHDPEGLADALIGYEIGQPTTRLRDKAHAIELAREWMRHNAPDGTLVHWLDDDRVYYPAGNGGA